MSDEQEQRPPKIVHQIWFDFGAVSLSRDHDYLIRRNRRIAAESGFEYRLWDLESADELLRSHYPYLRSFLFSTTATRFNIVKCDFFRYVLMYHYGGIYMDLDFYVLGTFEDIYDRSFGEKRSRGGYEVVATPGGNGSSYRKSTLVVGTPSIVLTEEWYDSINSGGLDMSEGTLHNGFLLSVPGMSLWWDLICDIHATSREVRERSDVWRVSGTNKLRNTYLRHCVRRSSPSSSTTKIMCLPYYCTCPYKCEGFSDHDEGRKDTYICRSEDTPPRSQNESRWAFITLEEVETEYIRAQLRDSVVVCVLLSGGSLWMRD